MKKYMHLLWCLLPAFLSAQTAPRPMEELNKATGKAAQETAVALQNAQLSAQQIQLAIENVKGITRVFDPVRGLHNQPIVPATTTDGVTQPAATDAYQTAATTQPEAAIQEYFPESSLYNTDGSANWGNQNHNEFGCYLDVMRGNILDELSVALEPGSVDLIFTATNHFGNDPAYGFLTPAYVKNDFFANYYFRGPKYKDANVPPKTWETVNESEVAFTNLTGAQFERIQTNDQIAAVAKQTTGFRDHVESRTKLTGKVLAVRTEMADRTCYGLIYIADHFGTTGANGYLKVKIKVTGFDADADGRPDAGVYQSAH